MNTHTDRIRQMAQEAGFDIESTGIFDPTTGGVSSGDMTQNLTRFAQLVAEDCARVVGYTYDAEAIRARYSLKD